MWRWVFGIIVAILFGWWFWRLGTIPVLPPALASYAQAKDGQELLAWIGHPQTNENRVLVNGSIAAWLEGGPSWFAWLRGPSRWLHERVGRPTGLTELHRVVSSFANMRTLADAGKSGTASKAFLDEEYRWKERLEKEGPTYKETLRQATLLGYWMFADIDDNHGAYRIKQQLEDWRLKLSRDETESLALRLMSLDARANESAKALEQSRFEEAALAASVSSQGLDNVAHDMDRLRPYWQEGTANAFGEMWSRLHAQTTQLKDRIVLAGENQADIATVEPGQTTSTVGIIATSTDSMTTSTVNAATTTTPVTTAPTSTPSTIRRISVIPSSTSLSFGQTISLRAFAIDDDGGRNDVTPRCQFSAAPAGFGQIDKQLFSAFANAGSAVITATCQLENQPYTGSVTVEVRF